MSFHCTHCEYPEVCMPNFCYLKSLVREENMESTGEVQAEESDFVGLEPPRGKKPDKSTWQQMIEELLNF